MSASLLIWAVYALGVWTGISILQEVLRWRTVYRVYGGIPISLMGQMIIYATKNRPGKAQLLGICVLFLGALLSTGYLLSRIGLADSQAQPATNGIVLSVMFLAWGVMALLNMAIPPTVLLLGTSHGLNIMLKLALGKGSVGRTYRIVSLLKPRHHVPLWFIARFSTGDLRTDNNLEWRTIAYQLMDVVPAIIFDDTDHSEYATAEFDRIQKRGLSYKTVFLSRAIRERFMELNPDPEWVERASTTHIRAITASDNLMPFRLRSRRHFNRILHEDEKLGRLLIGKVRAVLAKQADISRRRVAQAEYTEMYKRLPFKTRFNAAPEAIHARYCAARRWHLDHYLSHCKGILIKESFYRLLEDIPSIVSSEEERQFLDSSIGLDEGESIAVSVLETAQESRSTYRTRSLAVGHLMLGEVTRYGRKWPAALDHLHEAASRFDGIAIDGDSSEDVLRGLSFAHFLTGEVHMALYREAGHRNEQIAAEAHFMKSVEIDKRRGMSNGEARSRLLALRAPPAQPRL